MAKNNKIKTNVFFSRIYTLILLYLLIKFTII